MKLIALLLISTFLPGQTPWLTDINQAKTEAYQKHKMILLNFSGSDWCSPCIQLKKKIFNATAFSQFADSSLVLVNADFPRKKKNKPTPEQAVKNDALAEKYNPDGKFPYTLLLDASGRIVKAWDGYPDISSAEFVQQIQDIVNAAR